MNKTENYIRLIDPVKYFERNAYNLDQKELRELHDSGAPSGDLIRFLNHMQDYIFAVFVIEREGKGEKELLLIYAEFKKEFTAIALPVPIENYQLANEATVVFAGRISDHYTSQDFFDVYNTYQYHRQTALEALGYFTFDPHKAPKDAVLLSTQKLIPVDRLDRIDVLKTLYQDTIDKPHLDLENKIYLMLDNTNGLIKIGKSKNPKYREGTLQSKQPQTILIATWTAPGSIEKELHERYRLLRKRGEWFRLSMKELDEIKEYMDNLE